MNRLEPTEGVDLLSMLPGKLEDMAIAMGLKGYRGSQLFSWIHKRGVMDPEEMTNLPRSLRDHLSTLGPILPMKKGRVLLSSDGTRKIEVILMDGSRVETVLIPESNKLTQCISTQVGCAVGCVFCRSGKDGLKRNLTAAEIVGQIFLGKGEHIPNERLRNVVLMGVGEPLHNLDRVLRAIELMGHPDGLGLSSRRVTLSTVGIPLGIDRLAKATSGMTALAISLHAADEETRKRLVPGVSAGLADIVKALKRYPLPKRRRFTIEYVLVKGINDSDVDARNLVRLVSSLKVKVNLIPLNPHDRTDLTPPDEERVAAFQNILTSKGVSAFLRRRRGADINAACGQLLA
jgi:23S rRNA (adenine2503-C2)-methyltransferase